MGKTWQMESHVGKCKLVHFREKKNKQLFNEERLQKAAAQRDDVPCALDMESQHASAAISIIG